MGTMRFDHGKIKLGLRNVNLNVLSGPDTRDGSRRNGSGDDGRRRITHKGKDRLGFSRIFLATARAIDFQAPSNFTAPFGFGGTGCGKWGSGLGNGEVGFTKRAHFNVLVSDCATLRADLNHSVRFALRTDDWRTAAS